MQSRGLTLRFSTDSLPGIMAIVVECECGKRFRAKDELAGKNLPCPGCGAALTIPMPAPAPQRVTPVTPPPPKPSATQTVYPGYAARPRPGAQAQQRAPRVTVSGRTIFFIALLIIVPTVLWAIKMGPVKAMSQWKDAKEEVSSDITTIIQQAAEREYQKQGYELKRAQDVPQVRTLVLDEPVMMMSFPEKIDFQGRFRTVGTGQDFKGTYYTKPHRVVADVKVMDKEISIDASMANGGVTFTK
jgi:hypothetical protein